MSQQQTDNTDIVLEFMEDIELSLKLKYQLKYRTEVQLFKRKYSTIKASDIQWCTFCRDANAFGCLKFAFLLFTRLLEAGVYHGEFEQELYAILPKFQECASNQIKSNVRYLLCGDRITDLIIYHNNSGRNCCFGYAYLKSSNPYIKAEILDFLEDERMHNRWHRRAIIESFEISFGDLASGIRSYADFTDITFWEQINYYKKVFSASAKEYKNSIKAVCCFYRWLVNKYTEHPFFNSAFSMTKSLLFSSEITRLIGEGYYFMTYNPHAEIADHKKICFILRNMNHISTNMTSEDYTLLDLSGLQSWKYRKAVLGFFNSATSISAIHGSSQFTYVIDSLEFIEKLKAAGKYPNPDPGFFTTQEAVLIRNYCNEKSMKLSTKNNWIGAVRRFLQWCERNHVLTFEPTFFDYLRQYEEPSKTSGHSIPDGDLARISCYLHDHASESAKMRLTETVFHLALQTEFRISQILHLTPDCIRPSLKSGEYVVHSNSKSSHGTKNDYVITEATFRLLMDTVEFTEPLRASCNIEALKDYIFIYRGRNKSICHYSPTTLRDCLKAACEALGLQKNYSASDLRDTHMTKALEYIIRSGKSDLEMGLLSRHRHLDTTKNHYIELELEKMLEATYGITIGSTGINAASNIVDKIPSTAQSSENDVEYGCGKCTASECVLKTSLPCMVCKYFVTTVDYAPFFIQAIENIDQMIKASKTRHDAEDLVVIKNLYGAYLEAIYKIQEHMG